MAHTLKHDTRYGQSFTLAVMIELAVFSVFLIYYFFFSQPQVKVHSQPVTLTLKQIDTPVPPKPKPTPPKPIHKVISPPVHKIVLPKPITPPVPVKNVADAFSQHVSPPPPPVEQSAVDQSLKDKLLSAYIEKLRQAIQAALIYPVAAKQMGITGRVRVQFELNAGQTPTQVTILDSSGTGMFDRYAVKAVNEANYPSPPTELKASNGSYQIWVEFKN